MNAFGGGAAMRGIPVDLDNPVGKVTQGIFDFVSAVGSWRLIMKEIRAMTGQRDVRIYG
jgi:hypothetical protein